MFDMFLNSVKLFFTGKLFRETGVALRQLLVGMLVGAAVIVGVGQIAPMWVAAISGGAVAGLLQPMLFKNLKYA